MAVPGWGRCEEQGSTSSDTFRCSGLTTIFRRSGSPRAGEAFELAAEFSKGRWGMFQKIDKIIDIPIDIIINTADNVNDDDV